MKGWVELKEWVQKEEGLEFLVIVHADDYSDSFVFNEIDNFFQNDLAYRIVDRIEGIPYQSITVAAEDLLFRVYYDPLGGISSFVIGEKSVELDHKLRDVLLGVLKELNEKFNKGE